MRFDFDTDNGAGPSATLGVIVLETDETLEPEFSRIFGDLAGVALYHSRIPMVSDIRPDTLKKMEADLPAAAALLPAPLEFDVIGYGCTSAASVIGSNQVARAIQSVFPKALVTDPLAAIIAGCRHVGASRIAYLSPYVAEVSSGMRDRLEQAGISVTGFGSFEEGNDHVVARISERSIEQAAVDLAQQTPCDAVVISCTNLRSLGFAAELEDRLGKPVISSNLALAWHMAKLAGLDLSDRMPGRLFAA